MIFITGCARSGTSLVTKLLQINGAYLGDERRVNVLFENVSIRENVLKPYLTFCGADPLGQDVLPDTEHLPPPHDDLKRALKDYLPRLPRAYKDAKLTLVWPAFHAAWPYARWVLVRREKQKIVESCMRAPFMRKRKTVREWEEWVDQHEQRFTRMREQLSLIEVWTDDVITHPHQFKDVTDFLELSFLEAATMRAIDPRLWHGAPDLHVVP